ncbi:MAG: hypothetical protein LBS19_14755 [Clostridiales bacterium]|jgi:ABC-2 type transport system permease protein|nr:hypothetical protein [Clostridiales bacterium]
MSTLFRYELRRLVLNKIFIALLIITVVYAWMILTGETILGAGYTAPYSDWSFGAYLASVMPMAMLTVLLLMSGYYSKKEKRVEILLEVTPMRSSSRALLRIAAITVCFGIVCGAAFGTAAWFYMSVFGRFADFLGPSVTVILPCYVFTLGLGFNAGRVHPAALYALMPLLFGLGSLNLGGFDLFGGGFFESRPVTLEAVANSDPAFDVGAIFIAARVLYFAAGGLLLAAGILSKKRIGIKA